MVKIFCALMILASCTLRGEDIVLSDGTIYKNATVVSHDAVNVTILYSDGGVSVAITKLTPEMQKKLGYDKDAAQRQILSEDSEKAAEQRAAIQVKIDKAMANLAVQVSGEILQVLPEGFLAKLDATSTYQVEVPHHQESIVQTVPAGMGLGDVRQTHDWTSTETQSSMTSLGRVYVITDTISYR